jgi:DNA-binding transcriptional LysR family regulator
VTTVQSARSSMELRQLRYFVTVAEERNFRLAALRLRISQSAVSQQIKTLERTLRVRLFDREARPVELTHEGEILLEQARVIVQLADRAEEQLRATPSLRKKILKFGGSSFGNGPVIDRILDETSQKLPEVDLQVLLDTTAHNIVALSRRAIDVAFAYWPYESSERPQFLRLGAIELLLALPEDHRLAKLDRIPKAELLEEPFLMGPRSINPPLYDRIHQALIGMDEHPKKVLISSLGAARFRLVTEGKGISPVAVPTEPLLPLPGIAYRQVEGPTPAIEYGLVWFDDHVSPALPAFLDLAREVVRTMPEPSELDLSRV